jgi:hypothetical protein
MCSAKCDMHDASPRPLSGLWPPRQKRTVRLGVLLLFGNRLKLHQILCDQYLAGKVFLYFLVPGSVILRTDPLGQV